MSTTEPVPAQMLQMQSLVTPDGTVEMFLATVDVPEPGPQEVLVRVDAAPINPSDLGLLFAGADIGSARSTGTDGRPSVSAPLPPAAVRAISETIS